MKELRDMVYALWDTRTTNLVAAYDNERDALKLVLSGIERNGPSDTDTLVLEVEDEDGDLVFTAQGQALAEFARMRLGPAPMTD
jgi:hypothetical protein